MAELNTRIVLRHDTTANWEAVADSAVLLKGEVGIEFLSTGEVKIKIGDGTLTWRELDYFGGEVLVGDGSTIVVDGQTIKLQGFEDAEVGAQLVKGENGALTWIKPAEANVEELETTVSDIQTSVSELGESVGALEASVGEVPEGKTIVQMITESTYNDTALIDRIAVIEGDYLTSSDSSILRTEIASAKQEAIDAILGETINEDFDTLQEIAAWIQSDTTNSADLISRVSSVETKLQTIADGAQVNVIDSVDTEQFGLDAAKNLTLLDVAMSKVTGLAEALAAKVDVVEGYRLITDDEATKLESLVVGEDGSIQISGEVHASKVQELDAWITQRASTLEGLSENNLTDALVEKINASQENVIESVKINNTVLNVVDKTVVIPVDDNSIGLSDAGALEVKSVNVSKLVQTDGDTLILNGGDSGL